MTESEKKEVVVAYQVLDAVLSETTYSLIAGGLTVWSA